MTETWQPDLEISAKQGESPVAWHVPEEAPVALVYNSLTFAVMLASPSDLGDFVTGFSLTEGIIGASGEILGLEVRARRQGIDLHITIPENRFERLSLRQDRRSMEGRTSCGLCGIDSAERLFEPPKPVAARAVALNGEAVTRAVRELDGLQPLRALNRSVHAAAWAAEDGTVMLVREDVGRHNALDKLIGAMAAAGVDAKAGFVLVTSRASFEMVEKAIRAGATRLVALSAPTGFAIRRSEAANLTLANFSGGVLTVF